MSMSMLLALTLIAQVRPSTQSAVSATTEMYDWYCGKPDKTTTILCTQRSLSKQLRTATTDAAKEEIRNKLTQVNANARAKAQETKGLPSTRSQLMKDFSEMKLVGRSDALHPGPASRALRLRADDDLELAVDVVSALDRSVSVWEGGLDLDELDQIGRAHV